MDWLIICLAAGIGYLLGSLNGAVIISRGIYRSDIREHGSGNAGTTNMLRTFGKSSALLTLVFDFVKGILACVLAGLLVKYCSGRFSYFDGVCTGGLFAVFGHNWPVYFGFKGGKGVLTGFAVMLMISPYAALCALGVFIVIVAVTRYVSLGSILAAFSLPLFVLMFRLLEHKTAFSYSVAVSIIFAVLIIVRHRANIGRLIKGSESKLSFKSGPKSDQTEEQGKKP
ncbi:MAG: glycerol-3-phosphate 1-O-acyltransferase PlsY [Clostridia bacterium]|nr:glycerol-3-phosphate 1-O-acyltransferase PlsY [Clostridia bacterium]